MALWAKLKFWGKRASAPITHQHGSLGEAAAKAALKKKGLKFLSANFSTPRGELDLIFRDGDCLVFVEVKTRGADTWTRPSRAVNAAKEAAMRRTATAYLRLLPDPYVKYRFDIVEVLLEQGEPIEIRHLENCFSETPRRRKRRAWASRPAK